MQWREPFGQLRPENGERGHAAERGEMAGTGIIADERGGVVNQRNQFRDGARRGDVFFPALQPPTTLIRIAHDLHLKTFTAQVRRKIFIFFQRPDADGLPRAGVDQNGFRTFCSGNGNFFARWQFQIQCIGDDSPRFITMRLRFGSRDGMGEKNPAAHARETDALFRADQFQKQVVARIPARGKAEVEMFGGEFVSQPDHFQKRPMPEVIFVFESGPWRDKSLDAHVRPEARLQVSRERLGEQRDVEFFSGGAQERRGDDEVAESPQFDDEQFGFQGGRISLVDCGNLPLHDRVQARTHRHDGFGGGFGSGLCRGAADAAVECDA